MSHLSLSKLLAGQESSLPIEVVFGEHAGQPAEVWLPQALQVTIVDDTQHTQWDTLPVSFIVARDTQLIYRLTVVDDPRYAEGFVGNETPCDYIDKKLTFKLNGPGATAELSCVCFGSGSRVISLRTMQHHVVGDTSSNLLIKGALEGNAKLICNNLIRIEENAQKVVAKEMNKNLLLSDQARVITIPKLEVYADDVSALHGASISRLNDNDIFYCQSRGMSYEQATEFLINSFLTQP